MTLNGHEPATAGDDLHVRLHALHFSTTGIQSLLEQVTVLAADTLDVDSSAGVTIIREGQATTVAASDERTGNLDEIQYDNGDGPCLSAARTGEVIAVADMTTDGRWPDYGARASTGRPEVLAVDAVAAGRRRGRGVEPVRLRTARLRRHRASRPRSVLRRGISRSEPGASS
jgi:hypothetical protein